MNFLHIFLLMWHNCCKCRSFWEVKSLKILFSHYVCTDTILFIFVWKTDLMYISFNLCIFVVFVPVLVVIFCCARARFIDLHFHNDTLKTCTNVSGFWKCCKNMVYVLYFMCSFVVYVHIKYMKVDMPHRIKRKMACIFISMLTILYVYFSFQFLNIFAASASDDAMFWIV